MKKVLGTSCITLLATMFVLTLSSSNAHAQGSEHGQVFGTLNTHGSGGGSDAYVTTPDPLVIPGSWSAALVATGNNPVWPFIESGAMKTCNLGCDYNPYYSFMDKNGVPGFNKFSDIHLLSGGWYEFKNYFIGNDLWEAQFCDGTGCTVLIDANLHTSLAMSFEASGGESLNFETSIGTATSYNRWWHGVWSNYCYDTQQKNVGSITPCGGNWDWSVSWLFAGNVLLPMIKK